MDQDILTKLEEIKQLDARNEKIAIGHMLQDEVAAITGTRMLIAKYFITPHAAHVFKIVKSYVEEGKSVSDIYFHIHSIAEEDWQSFSQGVAREEYLRQCMVLSVPFLGTDVYAEGVFGQIQKQYFRREAFFLYENAKPKILNTADSKDLTEIVTDIGNKCNALLDGMTPSNEYDYETEVMEVLNTTEQAVISSGFKDLDQIIEGFRPGQLITVGAGTGVGKSAFAVNLALNITNQGYKVGLWSF